MSARSGFNAPMQVVRFVGSRAGDADRGPAVWMREEEAKQRLLLEGELVWVYGPRRQELATLIIDDALPRGGVVVRDIAGIAPSEIVRVVKPDLDRGRQKEWYA